MAVTASESVHSLSVDSIHVLNPRERNRAKFKEIVDSIAAVGLKKPITVSPRRTAQKGKSFNLVCGQGRLEAFRLLGQTEIPAIVVDLPEDECFLFSLIENLARRQHTPLELMRDIGRLAENGYSASDIAAKTGLSTDYVLGIIHLVEKGEVRLLNAVERNKIPVSVAVTIAGTDDIGAQKALTDAYQRGDLRGHKLQAAIRIVRTRERHGKQVYNKSQPKKPRVTARSMVRAYKQELERQRSLIRKADLTDSKLTLIVTAFRQLMADEHFVTLLRAEGLVSLPKLLADRLSQTRAIE